jgi:hypothetical protein
VVAGCPFGEQFRVVVVGQRSTVFAVWQCFWLHVHVVEGHLALVRNPEFDDSLDAGVDGLVQPHDDVLARLPFEAPLTCDDVVGVDLLLAEHLDAEWKSHYPSLLPAESLVFCVEEACILEAMK